MAFQPESKGDDTNPFVCPIGQEIMKKPVVLACGHTFEEINIDRWFDEKPNYTCPTCRKRPPPIVWRTNLALIDALKFHQNQIATLIKAPLHSRRASAFAHPHFHSHRPSASAAYSEAERFPFNCSITNEIMTNPVVLNCGHTFEEKNIRQWVATRSTCPTCHWHIDGWVFNFALKDAFKYHQKKVGPLIALQCFNDDPQLRSRPRRASAPHLHFHSPHPSFFGSSSCSHSSSASSSASAAYSSAAAPLPLPPAGAGFPPHIINRYADDDADII